MQLLCLEFSRLSAETLEETIKWENNAFRKAMKFYTVIVKVTYQVKRDVQHDRHCFPKGEMNVPIKDCNISKRNSRHVNCSGFWKFQYIPQSIKLSPKSGIPWMWNWICAVRSMLTGMLNKLLLRSKQLRYSSFWCMFITLFFLLFKSKSYEHTS